MSDYPECLIIGGGPAGLTAALYLARFRRRVALIDNDGSRAGLIPVSHNFPGFPDGVTGPQLLARLHQQLQPYPVAYLQGTVESLIQENGLFRASFADNETKAPIVLITTGIADGGMTDPNWSAAIAAGGLRICPVCDAYEVIDKRVAVVARSENAAAHARFLQTYTKDLTLIHAGDGPLADDCRADLERDGVTVIDSRDVRLDIDPSGTVRVIVSSETLRFDAVYPMFGCRPRAGLAQGLGAACDEEGKLLTDAFQQTSVENVFAAGDVVSGLNQISVAVGQAAIAATHIHHKLAADGAF